MASGKPRLIFPCSARSSSNSATTVPARRTTVTRGRTRATASTSSGHDGNSYSGTYDFIEVPVPPVIEGKVTGAGGPLSGALVEAISANPKLNYALTFADGSYTLFAPAGAQTLKASAAGYTDATRQATSPQTGADLDPEQGGHEHQVHH